MSSYGGWGSLFVGNGFRGTDIAVWQDSGAYIATAFGLVCCWTDRIRLDRSITQGGPVEGCRRKARIDGLCLVSHGDRRKDR